MFMRQSFIYKKNMIKLREYQNELIEKIRGLTSSVVVIGCGAGKSVIASEIARLSTFRKNRVLFLVHRQELCSQIRETFKNNDVDFQYCDIAMVQTFRRKMKTAKEPKVIIIDEAHTNFEAYKKICENYPNAYVIGFTATPVRLGSGGLGKIYKNLIEGVSTEWLIENNYLSPYKYYSVKLADTSKLKTSVGDYDKTQVAELMQKDEIYGDTVDQYERIAKGKKTIVYCGSLEASKKTSEQFNKRGYKSYHLDGSTPQNVRNEVVEAFRSGDINILCNMDLFGVGFDVPDCECVILLRPTKSLALFIQQSMRSMRYKVGKQAVIIDHVGNCYLHGLPDDKREWTLESKKRQENIVKIKECPKCFMVYAPTKKACPFCNTVTHIVKETVGKKIIDIDLIEVERKDILKKTKLNEFEGETFEQVREYQQIKGYKFGWVIRYCVSKNIEIPKKYNYLKRIQKNY